MRETALLQEEAAVQAAQTHRGAGHPTTLFFVSEYFRDAICKLWSALGSVGGFKIIQTPAPYPEPAF